KSVESTFREVVRPWKGKGRFEQEYGCLAAWLSATEGANRKLLAGLIARRAAKQIYPEQSLAAQEALHKSGLLKALKGSPELEVGTKGILQRFELDPLKS